MNRGIQLFISVIVVGMLLLVGCQAGATATATATATRVASAGVQAGQGSTNNTTVTRVRPTRETPTATPTAVRSTATPTPQSSTPTPPVLATATISALAKMALPDKATALTFPNNATTSAVNANLVVHQPVAYQFQAKAGQVVQIAVNGNTNLQVFGPNKNALTNVTTMPGYLSLVLPDAGAYTIGLDGLGNTTMSVYLPAAGENLASAAPAPAKVTEVNVPKPPFSVFVESTLSPGVNAGYTFSGQAGETLTLAMQYNVVPVLLAPDGSTLVPDTSAIDHSWAYVLPQNGAYTLVMLGTSYGIVQIKVTALPAKAPAQASNGTRIAIPDGGTALSFNTYFDPSKPQTYVINSGTVLSMNINVSGAAAITKMTGPDGKEITLTHSTLSASWSTSLAQSGDYTILITGSGPSTVSFSIPLNIVKTPYMTPTY